MDAVIDDAASGLSLELVERAARARCGDLIREIEVTGYDRKIAESKGSPVPLLVSREAWIENERERLADDIVATYVDARAGQCWRHRRYLPGS